MFSQAILSFYLLHFVEGSLGILFESDTYLSPIHSTLVNNK